MKKQLIIPSALQINIDDTGWWCGSDDRKIGGPSRTAMPRPHCAEDYQAIADLGEALNMEITCAFVMGEWDMDNRLSKEVPYFSNFGDSWNNKAYRNPEEMKKVVEIINGSPYIDVALHGLYHGYYMPGVDNPDISDYYYRKDGILYPVPEEEIRNRIEHFFRLLKEHGIEKKVTHFIPPSGAYRDFDLTAILKDYGIKYSAPLFNHIFLYGANKPEEIDRVFIENGIITVDRETDVFPWEEVESDFNTLERPYRIMGFHWPNMLNIDPQKHSETLKNILPYFRRCAETFGVVISRNMAFCATQALCEKYAKVEQIENTYVIDLTEIPEASGKLDTFFISTKTPPVKFENCTLGEVQEKTDFINYEIKPEGKIVKIHF